MSAYLTFRDVPPLKGRKTGTLAVLSKSSGSQLGTIRWFGRWRQFCFYPEAGTIFNPECLRDIAGATEALTKSHRAKAAR